MKIVLFGIAIELLGIAFMISGGVENEFTLNLGLVIIAIGVIISAIGAFKRDKK